MWSIDSESGHCMHGSGLHVYFDRNLTSSGGLRCVGPYSVAGINLCRDLVSRYLLELSQQLELQICSEDGYVIWGAFADKAPDIALTLELEKQTFGFVPNMSMRTETVFEGVCDWPEMIRLLDREWDIEYRLHRVTHRCGLEFQFVCVEGEASPGPPVFVPKVKLKDVDQLLESCLVCEMGAEALSPFAFRIFLANSNWPLTSVCNYKAIQFGA
jgi:hypothetical protein